MGKLATAILSGATALYIVSGTFDRFKITISACTDPLCLRALYKLSYFDRVDRRCPGSDSPVSYLSSV